MYRLDRATIFERSSAGSVVVGIWFDIAGHPFPALGWDDRATNILTAGIRALTKITEGSAVRQEVHFTEGPFVLEFNRVDETRAAIRAVKLTTTRIVMLEEVVTVAALAEGLVLASKQLLAWCREVGWYSEQEAELERATGTLESEVCGKYS